MSKTDDNREEILDEDVAAEGEDEDTSSDTDDQEETDDTSDEEESEEESDDDAEGDDSDDEEEDDSEEDDADDEDEEDDEEDEEEDSDPSGKFKGKSRGDIIKSYRHLERTIGDRAQKLAQEYLKKNGITPTKKDKEEAGGEDGEEFDLGVSDEEIAKMKPREFAALIGRKITEKANDIARNAIERSNEVRQNVRSEIQAATKAHPHLKTNTGYRDVVITMIEAAAAKGETLSLKEACKRADKAMNIKPGQAPADDGKGGDGEKKKKKKHRTSVERAGAGDAGKPKTDADRVREGLMGEKSTGTVLGGLY